MQPNPSYEILLMSSQRTKKLHAKQGNSPEISRQQVQKLTPQFFFFYIYILDIDSHYPYLLLFF